MTLLYIDRSRSSRSGVAWMAIAALTLFGCGAREEPPALSDAMESQEDTNAIVVADDGNIQEESFQEEQPTEFVRVEVRDERGFNGPMTAATVEIPADWSTRGGVFWDTSSDCVSNHLRIRWMASAPQDREALETLPGYSWQVQGTEIVMNPCPVLAIRSSREYLSALAQRIPGATVHDYRDRPDLLPKTSEALPGGRAWSEAGELRLSYQVNGNTVRETLTATLNFSEYQGNVVVTVPTASAHRAVNRQPNLELAARIRKSVETNPQWLAGIGEYGKRTAAAIAQRQSDQIATWHARRMAEINARGAMERSQIRAQTNREIAQIYSNTWANSQATDDRMHRRNLEAIGEYNTYADPSGGGIVRESTSYDRVLRTESGDYISTNDPYLNPAGSEELRRIP